jgi:two-component system sensor histidine kinase KdpD
LDLADQIELVDITPHELLKRFKEGKIYPKERADRATQHFFQEGHLTALREIALRATADKVDQELQGIMTTEHIEGPWETGERLMVAVSHSPYSERLIRATRRIAMHLEAPWIALYVDTGKTLSEEDQNRLVKNLQLSRELGGEVITTQDSDVVAAIRRGPGVKRGPE